MNMNAQEMWALFSKERMLDADYQVWAYGDDADELARLTFDGTKTATASLLYWYIRENLPLPQKGEYSVVLDHNDNAVCTIQSTYVYTIPFREVNASHAYMEGEGDRSLEYWREVHERFFRRDLAEAGMTFDPNMEVVCEEFIRVYP